MQSLETLRALSDPNHHQEWEALLHGPDAPEKIEAAVVAAAKAGKYYHRWAMPMISPFSLRMYTAALQRHFQEVSISYERHDQALKFFMTWE